MTASYAPLPGSDESTQLPRGPQNFPGLVSTAQLRSRFTVLLTSGLRHIAPPSRESPVRPVSAHPEDIA